MCLLVDHIATSSNIADPPLENILYCFDVWQPIFEQLKSQGVQLHNGMIDVEELKGKGRSWLVNDDLMNEVVGGKKETVDQIICTQSTVFTIT